ncbi:MAG: T-protein [Bacteroidetes bacterium ADurb.Bin408]|nr:MAG: T-protein [Bacteroidetes bacterium ADurb.Bin408]
MSQKALNLDMCGLMIETHLQPENAITDARQQITLEALKTILKELSFRKEYGDNSFQKQLEILRNEIDGIDAELLNLLQKRLKVVEKIGHHKKKHNIAVYQVKRWNSIIRERTKLAKDLKLDDTFILKILRLVHDESIAVQHKIMNKK